MTDRTHKPRFESDSMGEVQVPGAAYYGAQTQRAIDNFPISHRRFSRGFVRALGLVKLAAARVNTRLGELDQETATAIERAAEEVVDGHLDDHFVVDIFQTGSGTSTHMNANEVIGNRAGELLGAARGSKRVHPNDHVNRGQSSNDVIPTAIHLAALEAHRDVLVPALDRLHLALQRESTELDSLVKVGRTHLQDAAPVRLGQEFSGYARQIELARSRAEHAAEALLELAIGGTAVGTGLNAPAGFGAAVAAELAELTALPVREAGNHFSAQGAQDAILGYSGALRSAAVSVMKIANDIRWLASGPRAGLGEIRIPAVAPGSSIMPGKVNPVIAESAIQAAAQVLGNDLAVSLGAQWGVLELNTMLPLMGSNLLESIEILGNASRNLAERCIEGIEPSIERTADLVEQTLALATALVPALGYDRATEIAKEAHASGRTVRQVCTDQNVLPEEVLDRLLNPRRMTEPDRG